MKKFFVLIICMISIPAILTAGSISDNQAVEIVKTFYGDDTSQYDYYIVEDENPSYWTVFVDAEPLKLWEHDCYTCQVLRTTNPHSVVDVVNNRH